MGIGAVIILVSQNDNDEHKAPTTTEVMVEEPTTETTVEEEPTTETTEAEDTGATQATTKSPTKPENNEVPTQSETTEAPAPSAPTVPTTEEPKHEHNWVWVKTKDAWGETVVDKPAWTETKEHPEKYHWFNGFACHYCWQEFATSTEAKAHCDAQTDDYHFCAGYGSVSYKVVDEPAWTETIEHPAETHTVDHPEEGYYKCDCGATK